MAGALGGTHDEVAWDRTWSNPNHKKAHRGGMVLKLRSLVAVAAIYQMLRGQDGRVVKTGALGGTHDEVAWDRTWSNPDHKKSPQGRDGTEVTSPCSRGCHRPNAWGSGWPSG
jgi:hypothetical protein